MPTSQDKSASATKVALAKIRELKQQLAEAENASSNEPIAIVSTACRFPSTSSSPETFWQSLLEGRDETSELPEDRWDLDAYYDEDPDEPGKMYARRGTFLKNIDEMDADFFGISPREATWIDPQQRIFLEVSWEAMERAGWTPEETGKDTGVFVGWMHNDYQNEASESLLDLNPYIATGSAGSFLCGRLSYYLGIQGPSLAVDTACSSSLVALHLACQSLRNGECDRALAGGVNVMVSPKTTIMTCKLHALSPTGRSRAFDASADGYLRGEGCGVIALRRLSDAVRDGDDVLAVVSGSAITHNGFSSGLTAPNPDSQKRVIRKAVEKAGLKPSDIDYLEAHGTGTELGDPIELNAAATVLGEGREKSNPLLVGSVKTNLGHLEAAAGIAGVIKTVLAIQHGEIPKHLHFETPNPHIAWDRLPVQVVTEKTAWPVNGHGDRRIAGVSAFGMSGTNAHIILESAPAGSVPVVADSSQTPRLTSLLPLSGKTEEAVKEAAGRYRDYLTANPDVDLDSLCYAAATSRRHFEFRAAILPDSRESAITLLSTLASNGDSTEIIKGQARPKPVVAWQFTGQGSQYEGMGKNLYEAEPIFRTALDDCAAELAKYREGDLLHIMFEDGELLGDTFWTQPALFAMHIALAELMKSWGIKPDVVLGHSLGQYAAACVAGMLDWKDGMHLIHERARLVGSLPAGGAMAAVFADADDLQEVIETHQGLSIAARNGSHTVISGPEASVDAAQKDLEKREIGSKKLDTSHAFHSELLDPILDEFEKVADAIEFRPSECPLVCNVTGEAIPPNQILDGAYWRKQLREAVQYEPSVRSLAGLGCDVMIELGPLPILTGMAAACWQGSPSALIPTLKKDVDDSHAIIESVGRLYQNGINPDFLSFYRGSEGKKKLCLPTYPFQRQRHWGPERPGALRVKKLTTHPLLGEERALAGVINERRYESWVAPDRQHWLGDHRVFDDIIFPGAGYVEMAVAATRGQSAIENLTFEMPLVVQGSLSVQTVVRGTLQDGSMEIYSSAGENEPWVRHMTASLSAPGGENVSRSVSLSELEQKCPESVEASALYEMFANLGIQYGTEFQTVQSIRRGESDVLVKLDLSGDHLGFTLPPMLLDGALHSMAVGLLSDADSPLFLPVGIGKYHSFGPVTGELWSYGKWNEMEGEIRTADITLFDGTGKVVAFVENLQVRAVTRAALRQMVGSSAERLLYTVQWRKVTLPPPTDRPGVLIVAGEDSGWNEEVATTLTEKNQRVIQVHLKSGKGAPRSAKITDEKATLNASSSPQWEELLSHYFSGEESEPLNGVIWNTGEQGKDSGNYTRFHAEGILYLLQALRAQKIEWLDRGFQIVTSHAFSFSEEEEIHPDSSQFWGMGRVIGNEYPALRCRIVDLYEGDEKFSELGAALLTEARENQIAIRPGETFVPRLVHAKAPASGEGLPVNVEGTYLITGGLGNLGRRAGEWLASKGAGHVVLVSRREPTDSTKAMIADMEKTGTKIHVMLADIGERKSLEKLFKKMAKDLPPLKGLIHAAGVLQDGLLVDQTWEGFEKVLAPKKGGAIMLDELTRKLDLDFFVLYSSAASVMGSPGQANYATANAYLDALAHKRRAEGLPALSLNFGPWDEGMAATEQVMKSVAFQGITALTADEAHEAVDRLVDNEEVQATMLDVDWGKMRQRYPVDAPPILDELWPDTNKVDAGKAVLLEKLREAEKAGESREDVFREHVENELQQVLSLPEPPGADVPLAELGLDSLMAVEFSTRMQQQIGGKYAVAPTMAFDYPSVTKLTQHLMGLIDSVPAAEETAPAQTTSSGGESIAIVGLGCRFPGADGIDAYWELLQNGVDATREVPEGRWDMERFFSPEPAPGKMYTNRGGFIENIGEFDADFFGLSEQDAAWMDPQHRMLLETCWQALEDSGTVPGQIEDPNVGVFMGIMSTDYAQLREGMDPLLIEGSQGAGLSHSAGVGRINYMFGFEGPSIAVDTASSSSLVAVCQAARSLLEGDCNMALAGGVNAILSPTNSLLLSKGGVLSPDGRSKSFSAKADGFGRGEGCGVVVLKRRSDAERDGDRVLGLIRGTAITHNGQNGGLTVPSGPSQKQMIQKALGNAGVSANEVQYLEAHATGTEMGDPIEINAATEVLGKGRTEENELLIGSAKANLSHLEAAGGISGLIKVVLAMQHGVIPKQIHFDEPTPHVAWDKINARIVTEDTPWPNPGRPLAGVSALGMTGTNAHVIIEGLPVTDTSSSNGSESPDHPALLVLSGRSQKGLQELAKRYVDQFGSLSPSDFGAVCYASGAGRRHFENRAAVLASNVTEAREVLQSIAQGKPHDSAIVGEVESSPKIAWSFAGADGEISGAIRSLYATEPLVKTILDQCSESLKDSLAEPLLSAILEKESLLEESQYKIPALFASQMAMTALWRSWGVEPEVVTGDGVGQYAAACAAGILKWDDGLKLAAKRGSFSEGKGGKVSSADLDELEELANSFESRPAERALISSSTGKLIAPRTSLDGSDWKAWASISTTHKESGKALQKQECGWILEVGPPSTFVGEMAKAGGFNADTILLSPEGEDSVMLPSLAKLYVSGLTPHFKNVGKPKQGTKARIPTYPFQRKHYWITGGKNGSS